jgi:hypothetical protein
MTKQWFDKKISVDESGKEVYNHKQWGKCEVFRKYADVIVIKTKDPFDHDCYYKISPTGISHIPSDSKIIIKF